MSDTMSAAARRPARGYHHLKTRRSIWPSMERWLRDNRISYVDLAKLLGYKPAPSNYQRVRNQMLGVTELRKQDIDKLLKITGMEYERLFSGVVAETEGGPEA